MHSILLPSAGHWCPREEGRKRSGPQQQFPLEGYLQSSVVSSQYCLENAMRIGVCLEKASRKEAEFRNPCYIGNGRRNYKLGEEKPLGGSANCHRS